MELALCLPLIMGICGAIIVVGMSVMARFQMLSVSHDAVAGCASMVGTSVSAVQSCVANRVQQSQSQVRFPPGCQPQASAPSIIPVDGFSTSTVRILLVTQTLSCTYSQHLPFLSLLPGGQPSPLIISASSAAPFIPAN